MEFRTGRVAGYALLVLRHRYDVSGAASQVLGHRFCGPIGSIGHGSIGQDEGADLSRRVICSM